MRFQFFRRRRKPHVIVAHGDADHRLLLCRAIERWGYVVSAAVDGLELANLLSSAFRNGAPPAAVIVSTVLMDRTVVAALASIRGWDWPCEVVLLHDRQRAEVPGDLLGFAGGVVPPLAIQQLRRTLAQLLPERLGSAASGH